jgi:hypothetical protein
MIPMSDDTDNSGTYRVRADAEVAVDAETWGQIVATAQRVYNPDDPDSSPARAFQDAVDEHVEAVTKPVINGERVGPSDVPGLPDETDDAGESGNGDTVPNRGVLELEMSYPLIEWMKLEAEEAGADSLDEWVRQVLHNHLTRDLSRAHGRRAVDVTYEVPSDLSVRARLLAEARAEHDPDVDVEAAYQDIIVNHTSVDMDVVRVDEKEPSEETGVGH